jgi:protein-L-isoaspartate(D-aspartate) O-methyltransferase
MDLSAADQANQEMVDRLIAQGALWSPALIAAFRATPRHRFIDRVFQYQRKQNRWQEIITRDPGPDELRLIYADRALITRLSPARRHEPEVPISSSSQPSLMAQMLEDLRPAPGQHVLEVGAGTGYNAALLAYVVGPGRVLSIDVDRQVLAEAWDHLRAFPERRVEVRHADGRCGYAEAAPFDRIMVTAATPDLEPAWLEQLAEGGVVLAPLALAPGLAYVVRGRVTGGVFEGGLTRAAYFMPLRAEDETGPGDGSPPRPEEALRGVRAPWAHWFDRRRPRHGWHGLSQSLAFYGWLHGLTIYYQTLADGQAAFGVSDPHVGRVCWLGSQTWYVEGEAGYDLGRRLWRTFLDAGGPWPTEFRLRASPHGVLEAPGHRETYFRQGPRCQQLWELIEPRDRPVWI